MDGWLASGATRAVILTGALAAAALHAAAYAYLRGGPKVGARGGPVDPAASLADRNRGRASRFILVAGASSAAAAACASGPWAAAALAFAAGFHLAALPVEAQALAAHRRILAGAGRPAGHESS